MFQISAVRLYNFRSYRGKHSFKLPTAPGLYFITGTNEYEPALDANGAGKSTLLDAIYWCLYGQTTRGLRGSDIVSWNEKSSWVEVDLTVGDDRFTVSRAQSPNSLTVKRDADTQVLEQDALEKLLRLSRDAFKYGVMTPQYGKSFFERSPSEKLEVFSDILDLEIWLERSKVAEAEAKALEREKVSTTFEIEAAGRSITDAEAELDRLAERKAAFKEDHQRDIDRLRDELDAAKAEQRRAEQAHDSDTPGSRLEGYEKRIKEVVQKVNSKTEELYDLRRVLDRLNDQAKDVSTKISKLTGLGARCPTCLQPVDEKHIAHEQGALLDSKDEITTKLRKLEREYTATETVVNALKQDQYRAEVDAKAARDKARATAQAAGAAQAALKTATERVADLKGRLGSLSAKINPYASLMAEKREAIEAMKGRKRKLEGSLANIEADLYIASYWVTGFKRVRLMIIEDTLRELEVEVNNTLTSLGLADWSIALDIEKEKKTGGVTKGFHVFVQCPAYDKPVKWESWSGGESQRLQQAGDFGLSNLIMVQAGLQGGIEFYDEPSQHLSGGGLLDLAETLHQRALTQKKVILLIDHHTIDFGEFAGVCRVTKDDEGSYFGPWE